MSSLRSASKYALYALGSAQAALGLQGNVLSRQSESCSSTGLSCNSDLSNTCCVSSPGGLLLQTQFWDTDPSTGPSDSWTIHGLWPDKCDGSYETSCDSSRDYDDITTILQNAGDNDLVDYMNTYWVSDDSSNEDFWEHEWSKHGTCISTLDPSCYSDYTTGEEVPQFFQTVVNLFKTLPTYDWLSDAGITPSSDQTYSYDDIENALSQQQGAQVYLGCSDSELYQVYYYFNAQGPVQNGDFVATDPPSTDKGCPSSGIKYLPKSSGSS